MCIHIYRYIYIYIYIYMCVCVCVQGGIALTSPLCHKKQIRGLTKKSRLFIKRTAKWLS